MNRVVIDACIMGAANEKGLKEPAPSSVAVLEAVSTRARVSADLRLAMNDELMDEWTAPKPPSVGEYGARWLAEMQSRGLVDHVNDLWSGEKGLLEVVSGNHRKPIGHDIHLIRLAMITDRRILSLEKKLPRFLRKTLLRNSCPQELGRLQFATVGPADVLVWVQGGAKDVACYRLDGPPSGFAP